MVPRRLSSTLALALAALALLASSPTRSRALPVHDPGPFWALRLAHQGGRYADALPRGPSYRVVSGRLPAGLALEADGRIGGVPTETGGFELVLEALEAAGRSYPVRVALTVARADERDLAGGPARFDAPGPFATQVDELVLDVTNRFDTQRIRTALRVVRPLGGGPRPLLLFHRGRGFDEDSYRAFHERIASHGVAVASVEDAYSFAGASFWAENDQYDYYRAELGMLSASGVVEAVADYLLDRSDDPADPWAGSFDGEDLFFAGHSRGGGAVHASHQRSFELRLKGLIYLMAFDLRYFAEVAPPAAVAPAYPVFAEHPRTPCLIVAAENDGDLVYPIADQLIDRATGPATQVTLYGGVHNLISDSHPAEGDARISRAEEQARVADWIVCFVKRWADLDASLDARLYGPAQQGSTAEGVAWWRPSARTLLLEDAQDADAARNLVGPNLVANMRRGEESLYPPVGDLPRLGLRHTLLTPTDDVAIWRLACDRPLDVTGHRRLVLRTAQTSRQGWQDVEVWVRLIDGVGGASWHRVWHPTAGGALPRYTGLSPLDRFVEVEVPLDALFASGTPAADLSALYGVDLFLVRQGNARVTVAVDAVRFE